MFYALFTGRVKRRVDSSGLQRRLHRHKKGEPSCQRSPPVYERTLAGRRWSPIVPYACLPQAEAVRPEAKLLTQPAPSPAWNASANRSACSARRAASLGLTYRTGPERALRRPQRSCQNPQTICTGAFLPENILGRLSKQTWRDEA